MICMLKDWNPLFIAGHISPLPLQKHNREIVSSLMLLHPSPFHHYSEFYLFIYFYDLILLTYTVMFSHLPPQRKKQKFQLQSPSGIFAVVRVTKEAFATWPLLAAWLLFKAKATKINWNSKSPQKLLCNDKGTRQRRQVLFISVFTFASSICTTTVFSEWLLKREKREKNASLCFGTHNLYSNHSMNSIENARDKTKSEQYNISLM